MFCSQCKYFRKTMNLNDVTSKQGMCLRYPPKPFIMPAQGGIGTLSARPAVESGDYCGEFSLRNPPNETEELQRGLAGQVLQRTKTTG